MSEDIERLLDAVRSDEVEFATMRDPPSRPPSLERRVVLTAPPELVQLAATGDVRVLDRLVDLLEDPDRAWAAQVVLSALTRRDEKIVDGFATSPDEWLETVGRNAHARWKEWLDARRDLLVWDAETRRFFERA